MSASAGQHYSNEVLLSHLDHELGAEESAAVSEHLTVCWLCRSRLEEMEKTAQAVAERLTAEFSSGDRAARAREAFLRARAGVERELTGAPVAAATAPRRRWLGLAALAAAAAAVVAVWVWPGPAPAVRPAVSAGQAAARSEQAERRQIVPRMVTHQVFAYALEAEGKATTRRSGQVELWADAAGRRYAARLTDDRGRLSDAMWQPGSGGAVLLPAAFASAAGEADLPAAQERFERWVVRRPGAPLLLAAEFIDYCREAGLEMTLTPFTADGERRLRLAAAREWNGARMELALEITAGDYRVRRQRLRVWRGERRMELVVEARRTESLAAVEPSVFGRPVAPAAPPVAVAAEEARVSEAAPAPVLPERREDPRRLEIGVLYALHAQGVFGRDSWEVRREGARLRVKVVAATETRRQVLLEALRQLDRDRLIDTEIETWAESGWRPPKLSLPARGVLPADEAGAAFEQSSAVFGDGWALQQLAERFRGAGWRELDEESRALLERMLHDHLMGLQRSCTELSERLRPLGESPAAAEAGGSRGGGEWPSDVHHIFFLATQVRDRTQHLLLESPPKNAPVRQTAGELLALIDTLAREARSLDLTLVRTFERP